MTSGRSAKKHKKAAFHYEGDVISVLSALYLVLPIVIFLIFWVRPLIAVPVGILFLAFAVVLSDDASGTVGPWTKSGDKNGGKKWQWVLYWLILAGLVCLWVYFSGIGSFSYQNWDHYMRNAIYRDLCGQPWPVCYDLSKESAIVCHYIGTDKVAFVYYFAFWLVPAGLTKLLHAGESTANLLVYFWSVLGLLLILANVHRALLVRLGGSPAGRFPWKRALLVPAVFIGFSGLDLIGFLIFRGVPALGQHLEWWAGYFQYSANTTLLYWVFNQAIPLWLLVSMLLLCRTNRKAVGLCSLLFAYSPFATFGIIPLAAYAALKQYGLKKSLLKRFLSALTVWNIGIPLSMLAVFGSFYMMNAGSVSDHAFIWQLGYIPGKLILHLGLFLILEMGLYAVFLAKRMKRFDYLAASVILLVLIPLYHMTPSNDFAMRASLPALFLLMFCILRYLLEPGKAWQKTALIVLLVIGLATPFQEVTRSVIGTTTQTKEAYLQESIYSFAAIRSEDMDQIEMCDVQFFAHNYENSAFYRYIGSLH